MERMAHNPLTSGEVEEQLRADEEHIARVFGPSSLEELDQRRARLLVGDLGKLPDEDASEVSDRESFLRFFEEINPVRRIFTRFMGKEWWVPAHEFDAYDSNRAEHEREIIKFFINDPGSLERTMESTVRIDLN